jgi:hypothetical protein
MSKYNFPFFCEKKKNLCYNKHTAPQERLCKKVNAKLDDSFTPELAKGYLLARAIGSSVAG